MRRHVRLWAIATRFTMIGHLRNRFAMVLVAGYIPLWTVLAYLSVPSARVEFRLRATGQLLRPAGNQLTEITGSLNAVTLIIGFMMFASAFSGGHFDRRLAMAGYPRGHLVLAKITVLVLASGAVAVYATVVSHYLWAPRQPFLLAAALLCAALTYGAVGVALGSLLRREVEGMFTIVMISVIDVCLQNPVTNAGADSSIVRFLPSYGAVQASTAAGFSDTAMPRYLALQLLWFTAVALIGFLAFQRRTRNTLSLKTGHPHRPLPEQAARDRVKKTEV